MCMRLFIYNACSVCLTLDSEYMSVCCINYAWCLFQFYCLFSVLSPNYSDTVMQLRKLTALFILNKHYESNWQHSPKCPKQLSAMQSRLIPT